MRIYEGMFVLDDSRSNSNWDGVLREMRGLLERRGAEIFTAERWDERRLAYRINGRNRGVYLLTTFTAPARAIDQIKRDAEMNDTVLRLLVIRDHDTEKLHKAGLFPPSEEGEEEEQAPEGEEQAEKTEPEQGAQPKEGGTEDSKPQEADAATEAQGSTESPQNST